jgi:hypothetical protein
MPASDTAPALDDETTAALTLFNEYVKADRERTLREKRVRKAERAKDEAAAAVKKLGAGGSAEEKADAEEAYRAAAERWKALRDGKEPAEAPTQEPSVDEAPTGQDTVEGDAPAESAEADGPAEADDDTATSEAEKPSPETPADSE